MSKKQLTKEQLKQLVTPKVPIEVALEDLMTHLAKKKGVKKFNYSTKDNLFSLIWEEKGVKKYTSLTSKSERERKAIKSVLITYVRQFNKEIKEGIYDKKHNNGTSGVRTASSSRKNNKNKS